MSLKFKEITELRLHSNFCTHTVCKYVRGWLSNVTYMNFLDQMVNRFTKVDD